MPDDATALRRSYDLLARALAGQIELSVADQEDVLTVVSVLGKAMLDAPTMRRLARLRREVIEEARAKRP